MSYAASALVLIGIVVLLVGVFNLGNSLRLGIIEMVIGLLLLGAAVLYYRRGQP